MTSRYELSIANGTDYDLVIERESLKWGNYVVAPQTIKKNDSGVAVAVESERGCWTGLEFSVTWKTPHGSVSLYINIPFSSDNDSSLASNGSLRVEKWSKLPDSGHVFVQAIDVTDLLP